jgi:diaminohydroxyphosphoribosylaminopyrimidine deaminase/5-amino-6-(5-phosphoribosylamino)uracil reductase
MDILSVLMEAGGQLNGAALAAGIVDRITLFYAPVFLGPAGVPLLQEMIPGILPAPPVIECIGQDVRIEAELRDPWSQLQGLEC